MDNEQFLINHANVLIFEKSSSDLTLLVDVLRQSGCNIRDCKSSEIALLSAEEALPDAILVDVNMDDADGYEVCSNIKANERLMEVPVILISTDECSIEKEKVFASGAADYIVSPFNYCEVFTRIETQLKLRLLYVENKENKHKLQQCEQANEKLVEENDYLKKSLDGRKLQLEEITNELKEFNVLLEEEISERTKTEEALRESERNFRHAIERCPVPVKMYTEDGQVIKTSRTWSDITGYTIMDIATADKLKSIKKKLNGDAAGISDSKLYDFDDIQNDGICYVKTNDGDTRIYDVYSSCIGKLRDGRKLLSRAIIDITERIKLSDLRDYDKIKTEFFSNISHELRTPINVIFSALQVFELKLKDCSSKDLPIDKNKYIKIMKQNCYRLMRLIDNLIDITKIDSGYFDINESNVDIVNLIENITLSVADYIENKGLSLVFDTDIEEKIIACDPEKIERIILNLLSNAVKFTPGGGKIMVNIEDGAENINIIVRDTGRGIPEDKLNSIFERFVQVDKSLTRDHEGSGIGLSLVKSLVELHGGTISVKSTIGKGSEFKINIPCKPNGEACDKNECSNLERQYCTEKINLEFSDIYN